MTIFRTSARVCLSAISAACLAAPLAAQEADSDLVEAGRYVARTADCQSCHIGPDGTPYAGGKFIETPLGDIMATNITPSRNYGIGGYSEDDLKAVLREGKAPDRRLYPAMPYPSYHGMTDEDITALYAYLRTVEPVERAPEGETDLPFPFNIRTLMVFYNALAIEDTPPAEDLDAEIARGQYLVDHPGHCGTCHTPRNSLMMADEDRYLAGTMVQGWLAPNLTSDPVSGLGRWQAEDIAEYLKTGRAMGAAQAAGPMSEVVHFSTRHMNEADLMAMARYLKTVPAIASDEQTRPVVAEYPPAPVPMHEYGSIRKSLGEALTRTDLAGDEALYLTHCASCHGVNGEGQAAAYYPTLRGNGDLRRDNAANLVNVIAHGVEYAAPYRAPPMPGFEDDLTNDEIAQIANYVRIEFGDFTTSALDAADVNAILNPDPELPFLLKYANWFAWAGIIAVLALLGLIGWAIWRRTQQPAEGRT
ncbi:cytochrome c [Marivita sp. GX14005]|uniref:cytochrome c n=1 Tax=Marivita sp. GX14005 TaxID=2942276 RepID=UPI0020184C1F|nr:cytochrome c [Marivita sp. GX14005]MCL3883580.1 cytochrome c [Marivita sp. GX14005]